jgi:hypothetical protein
MSQTPPIIAPVIDYMSDATFTVAVTGSTVALDSAVANAVNPRSYLRWHAGLTPTFAEIKSELDQARAATCWGLTGHNIGTAGATLALLGSNDDITYSVIDSYTPSNDNTFLRAITATNKLTFDYWMDDPFDPYRRRPQRDFAESEDGHALGQVITYQRLELKPKFIFVDETFSDNFRDWFNTKGGEPFFWQWNPGGKPTEVYYMMVDPKWRWDLPIQWGPLLREFTLQMIGIYEEP